MPHSYSRMRDSDGVTLPWLRELCSPPREVERLTSVAELELAEKETGTSETLLTPSEVDYRINWATVIPPEQRRDRAESSFTTMSKSVSSRSVGMRGATDEYGVQDFSPPLHDVSMRISTSSSPKEVWEDISGTILSSVSRRALRQENRDKQDEMEIQYFNDQLSGFISGEECTRSQRQGDRSFLVNAWRRAPLVNYQYDAGVGDLLLSPESRFVMLWDMVIACAVGVTLIIAPVEFAFDFAETRKVTQEVALTTEIVTNIVFLMDIVINFNLMVLEVTPFGQQMIRTRSMIARRYIRQSLLYDSICALPFWLFQEKFSNIVIVSEFWWCTKHLLRGLQLVRLIRIFKLGRSHLLARPIMPYRTRQLVRLLLMAMTSYHLLACVWASLVASQPNEHTWLDELMSTKALKEGDHHSFFVVYTWSLYFSITLITTVGFGDVVPQTFVECQVAIFGIVVGSFTWAYIVSSIFNLIMRIDPHRADFEEIMDEVKQMMDEHHLSGPLLYDVQHYFADCEHLWKLSKRHTKIIKSMSPMLRGRICLALNGNWIVKIKWIRHLFISGYEDSTQFVAAMACKLEAKVFSPGEKLTEPSIYIVQKGLLGLGFQLLTAGDVCGEDLLVTNPQNRIPFFPIALTFIGTLALKREDLREILDQFPLQKKFVRNWMNWKALRWGLKRELRKRVRQRTSNLDSIFAANRSHSPSPTNPLWRGATGVTLQSSGNSSTPRSTSGLHLDDRTVDATALLREIKVGLLEANDRLSSLETLRADVRETNLHLERLEKQVKSSQDGKHTRVRDMSRQGQKKYAL